MQRFTEEGLDHMEWDKGLSKFVKTSPQDPPLMEVKVEVLSQVQKQFVGRRANQWKKLGSAKAVKEMALADTGAMVCTAGLNMMDAMGIQSMAVKMSTAVFRNPTFS